MLGIMGSEAAIGAYLRTLVERQADLTFAKVLRQAKQKPNYILRLESGDTKDPRARTLTAVFLAARGSLEDMARLLLDDRATAADGVAAAEQRLKSLLSQSTVEQRQLVARQMHRLADDLEAGRVDLPPPE